MRVLELASVSQKGARIIIISTALGTWGKEALPSLLNVVLDVLRLGAQVYRFARAATWAQPLQSLPSQVVIKVMSGAHTGIECLKSTGSTTR